MEARFLASGLQKRGGDVNQATSFSAAYPATIHIGSNLKKPAINSHRLKLKVQTKQKNGSPNESTLRAQNAMA
jgi:hypothetical protein